MLLGLDRERQSITNATARGQCATAHVRLVSGRSLAQPFHVWRNPVSDPATGTSGNRLVTGEKSDRGEE
jgi:hypothetical protein